MNVEFNGYYLSDRYRCEEWHAGVHMVDHFFNYLKLFRDGTYLKKRQETDSLDFPAYVRGVTEQAYVEGLAGKHPLDLNYDRLHTIGRFKILDDRLEFMIRNDQGGRMTEHQWILRIASPVRLVADSGTAYAFHRSE